jgi:Tol biopolymer transport system component
VFAGVTPARSDNYTIYFESDRDGDYRIFRLDGNVATAVTPEGCRHPSVTADGSMLFYTRVEDTLWGHFWNVFYLQNGVEEKLSTNEIYDELEPVISRDGTFAAFTTLRAGNLEIITLPMDFNELQYRITENEKPDELPALAGDGEYVYWTGRTGNNSHIFRAPGMGGAPERITAEAISWEEHPSVSADNRYMVYASVVQEEFKDEDTEEIVDEENAVSRLDVVWLADASKYPWMAEQADTTEDEGMDNEDEEDEDAEEAEEDEIRTSMEGNSDIWVVDLETMERTQLTFDAAWDGNPTISADGMVIVFTSNRDGNNEIYMINRDGSGLTRLTENEASDDYATIT